MVTKYKQQQQQQRQHAVIRYFSSRKKKGGHRHRRPQQPQQQKSGSSSIRQQPLTNPTTTTTGVSKEVKTTGAAAAVATASLASSSSNSRTSMVNFVRNWILPVRYRYHLTPTTIAAASSSSSSLLQQQQQQQYYYRYSYNFYTQQQGWLLLLYRIPYFVALVTIMVLYDDTAPLTLIRIHGPSMIPTMAPDGTDLWLIRRINNLSSLHGWYNRYVVLAYNVNDNNNNHHENSNNHNMASSLWMPSLRRGDLIGFRPPPQLADSVSSSSSSNGNDKDMQVSSSSSCKRIVGLPGDVVQRYGQYVHLHVNETDDDSHNSQHQQQTNLGRQQHSIPRYGISWPPAFDTTTTTTTTQQHSWIDPSCPWDTGRRHKKTRPSVSLSKGQEEEQQQLDDDYQRTLIVPPGHVWVEADCPLLGMDSRQIGPIPYNWIEGKVVARLWPLSTTTSSAVYNDKYKQRPHPIVELDPETIMEYNMYYPTSTPAPPQPRPPQPAA